MNGATLATFGWLSWAEATTLVGDAGATWLGPGSLIEQTPMSWPKDLPVTTRIHAWSVDEPLLWRLLPAPSRGLVLVTALRPETDNVATAWPATPHALASVVITSSTAGSWTRVWVDDLAPIMFLRPSPQRPMPHEALTTIHEMGELPR